MNTYFVTTDKNGYIDNWSSIKFSESLEIMSSEDYFGLLNCVKVKSGVAILDEVKSDELKNQDARTEVEKLIQENKELKVSLEKTKEDITNTQVALTELFEVVESLA